MNKTLNRQAMRVCYRHDNDPEANRGYQVLGNRSGGASVDADQILRLADHLVSLFASEVESDRRLRLLHRRHLCPTRLSSSLLAQPP